MSDWIGLVWSVLLPRFIRLGTSPAGYLSGRLWSRWLVYWVFTSPRRGGFVDESAYSYLPTRGDRMNEHIRGTRWLITILSLDVCAVVFVALAAFTSLDLYDL